VSRQSDTRSFHVDVQPSANWDTDDETSSFEQYMEGNNRIAKREVEVKSERTKQNRKHASSRRLQERVYDDYQSDQEISSKPQGREELDEPTLRRTENRERSSERSTPTIMFDPRGDINRAAHVSVSSTIQSTVPEQYGHLSRRSAAQPIAQQIGLPRAQLRKEISYKKKRLFKSNLTSEITSLAFSPDNKLLASGCPGETIRLWDITNNKL
jgi:WD40 repeat protein